MSNESYLHWALMQSRSAAPGIAPQRPPAVNEERVEYSDAPLTAEDFDAVDEILEALV
jgi:hypothetical protein